jgi:hypothetical protein
MSKRDLINNRSTLESFKGNRSFATLHTGSIHLRIGDPQRKGTYLWIDPPWSLLSGTAEITRSSHCPADDSDFREWCERFAPLRDTIFEDFTESDNGDIAFKFPLGFQLLLPANSDNDPDGDYDHWYAASPENPDSTQ